MGCILVLFIHDISCTSYHYHKGKDHSYPPLPRCVPAESLLVDFASFWELVKKNLMNTEEAHFVKRLSLNWSSVDSRPLYSFRILNRQIRLIEKRSNIIIQLLQHGLKQVKRFEFID